MNDPGPSAIEMNSRLAMTLFAAPAECLFNSPGPRSPRFADRIQIHLPEDRSPDKTAIEPVRPVVSIASWTVSWRGAASDEQPRCRIRGIAVNFWFPLQFGSNETAHQDGY